MTKQLTKYIAVWGWQILAIMFLCFTFVFVAMTRTNVTVVFAVSFFLIFAMCEYMSLKRKKELYHEV